jgi:hypothetical protein
LALEQGSSLLEMTVFDELLRRSSRRNRCDSQHQGEERREAQPSCHM